MFKIRGSFADCSKCPIQDKASDIAYTNSKDDLSKVNVVVVSKTTLSDKDKEEFKEGTKNIKELKFFMTSASLCGKNTDSEEDINKSIDICKSNYENFLQRCTPKIVILDEDVPLDYKYPSKVLVCKDGDYAKCLVNALTKKKEETKPKPQSKVEDGVITEKVDEPYTYRIPAKYYTDDYRLVDIQYISKSGQLIFIFRDKDNKRHEYTPPPKDVEYYWYEGTTQALIEDVKNTELKIAKFHGRNQEGHCYESDIKIASKQAVDYYMRNKAEAPIVSFNILFYDIEVYTGNHRGFPDPADAAFPINAISFKLDNGPTEMYLLVVDGIDPRWKDLKNDKRFERITIFHDEKKMLQTFINKVKQLDPDYISGWNSNGFDNPYIYNRFEKVGISANSWSTYNSVFCDSSSATCLIYGRIPLDQMWLYKNLTYTNEPSYSLENISQKVLKRGKKEYTGDLMDLYREDIFTFCEYSITDTDLLEDLETELGHISLQDELPAAATTSHNGASSTIGLADGLFNFELKSNNMVMRNTVHGREKESIIGAYVRDPIGGIYDWVIDFGYTSLYPSIICSFNI